MVGPSSSHTAGAIAIGALARNYSEERQKCAMRLLWVISQKPIRDTGPDFAIISGILGFATDDERVPRAGWDC